MSSQRVRNGLGSTLFVALLREPGYGRLSTGVGKALGCLLSVLPYEVFVLPLGVVSVVVVAFKIVVLIHRGGMVGALLLVIGVLSQMTSYVQGGDRAVKLRRSVGSSVACPESGAVLLRGSSIMPVPAVRKWSRLSIGLWMTVELR